MSVLRAILDAAMRRDFDAPNYLSLINTQTRATSPVDLSAFVEACGYPLQGIDLSNVDRSPA